MSDKKYNEGEIMATLEFHPEDNPHNPYCKNREPHQYRGYQNEATKIKYPEYFDLETRH